MADAVSTFKAVCRGGLNSGTDVLSLGAEASGAATQLVNYEPNLEGGYRKINGYANNFGTVGTSSIAGAGSVLGVAVANGIQQGIFAARNVASGANYLHYWNFYYTFTVAADTNLTVGETLVERTAHATASTATGVTGTLISKNSNTIVVNFGQTPSTVFTNGSAISDDSFSTSTTLTASPAEIGWVAITSDLIANDRNGVCAAQTNSGAANLTINGALHDSNTINFTTSAAEQPRKVTIFSAGGNVSGITFTITGTDFLGTALEEVITGPAADATVTSVNYFNTISQIASSGAVTGNIEVGSGAGQYRPAAPTMTGVTKVRFEKINFGTPKIVLTDGINPAATYDGTNYIQITDAIALNPVVSGDPQDAPTDPTIAAEFQNHLFLAGDPTEVSNLYFSAPTAETDYSPANGAGVINVGFEIVAIKKFRNVLYIFGNNNIKRLVGENAANFRLETVTSNLGCLATDSVVELGGDLLFLAPDGIRPIGGTNKIGDVNLETISKSIQSTINNLITSQELSGLSAVIVRAKSQFRYFFNVEGTAGLLGALREYKGNYTFEFGQVAGIVCTCADSGYIGTKEFVIHGDSAGKVFQQETGNAFDTTNILSVYKTPFIYMDNPEQRKNYYNVSTYMSSEGINNILLGVTYDYEGTSVLNPENLVIDLSSPASFYDSGTNIAVYDTTDIYDGNPSPVESSSFSGSGKSVSFRYVTDDTNPSHSIQGYSITYGTGDVR